MQHKELITLMNEVFQLLQGGTEDNAIKLGILINLTGHYIVNGASDIAVATKLTHEALDKYILSQVTASS